MIGVVGSLWLIMIGRVSVLGDSVFTARACQTFFFRMTKNMDVFLRKMLW